MTVERTGPKQRVEDLACVGGPPLFSDPLHVGRPHLGDRSRFMGHMADAWDRRWLTNDGPLLQTLETRLCDYLAVPHCVLMANATVALQLVLRAMGLTGEVILPSFTFIATAHAVAWQGLTPVFCDVDPLTHNLDPDDVERRITPRTTAIVGVHVWGRPAAVERLEALARKHGLKLVFDAAHAFGCSWNGHPIGRFGNAEVFSFHATKAFNTLEGGAVTTSDPVLAERLRSLRNFGFVDYDRTELLGTNAKMSEASAAMGLTSLDAFPSFVEENRRNYEAWARELQTVPGLSLVPFDDTHACNYHYTVAQFGDDTPLHRDVVWQILMAEGVLARRYFWPGCHRMSPYNGGPPLSLPHTERLSASVLCLPSGGGMSLDDIAAAGALLRFIWDHATTIADRLTARQGPAAVQGGLQTDIT